MADVPFELQRQFSLMRELDERSYRLQQQVDADILQQLKLAGERQQGALCKAGFARQRLLGACTTPTYQSQEAGRHGPTRRCCRPTAC